MLYVGAFTKAEKPPKPSRELAIKSAKVFSIYVRVGPINSIASNASGPGNISLSRK